ncbi:MAG: amino acid permease [Thermosphaera sp.]
MGRVFKWYDIALWGIANSAASGLLIYSVQNLGRPGVFGADISLSYILGGVAFLPIVLSMIQVGMFVRDVGGPYVIISKAVSPYVAFISIIFYMFASGAVLTTGFLSSLSVEFISVPIYLAGYYSGNGFLTGLGMILNSTTSVMVFSVLIVSSIWIVNTGGYKVVRRMLYFTTLFPLGVLLVLYMVALVYPSALSLSGSDLIDFESIKAIVFNAQEALKNNIQPLHHAEARIATLNYAVVAFWSYLGLEIAGFLSGETREPEKSFIVGGLTSYIVIVASYLLAGSVVQAAGYDYLASYSYLYMYHPDSLLRFTVLETVLRPSLFLPYYLAFRQPILVLGLGFAGFLFFYNTVLTSWASSLRAVHAISVDGLFPRSLGEFDPDKGVYPSANNVVYAGALGGLILGLISREVPQFGLTMLRVFNFSYGVMLLFLGLAISIFGIVTFAGSGGSGVKYARPKVASSVITGLLCFVIGLFIVASIGIGASVIDLVAVVTAGLAVSALLVLLINQSFKR